MEGCFMFQWGGHCFSDGGAPHGGHQFWWGGFEKNCKIGGGVPPAMPPTMGNPVTPPPPSFSHGHPIKFGSKLR